MKVPPGVLLTAPVCAALGEGLADFVEDRWRRNGLEVPEQVRAEVGEVLELGARFRAMRSRDVPAAVPALEVSHSPGGRSRVMADTCSSALAASRLGVSAREVRFLRARGRLRGEVVAGKLLIHAADVDRLVAERG